MVINKFLALLKKEPIFARLSLIQLISYLGVGSRTRGFLRYLSSLTHRFGPLR